MYSRIVHLTCLAATAFGSCSTYTAAAPGISPAEERVLEASYYWHRGQKPFTYTPEQLDHLLRRSADATLDGERAESQTSAVVWALATVGDDAFSQAVRRQSEAVKRAVGRDIEDLWRRYGLHYPKTESVLQPYT